MRVTGTCSTFLPYLVIFKLPPSLPRILVLPSVLPFVGRAIHSLCLLCTVDNIGLVCGGKLSSVLRQDVLERQRRGEGGRTGGRTDGRTDRYGRTQAPLLPLTTKTQFLGDRIALARGLVNLRFNLLPGGRTRSYPLLARWQPAGMTLASGQERHSSARRLSSFLSSTNNKSLNMLRKSTHTHTKVDLRAPQIVDNTALVREGKLSSVLQHDVVRVM